MAPADDAAKFRGSPLGDMISRARPRRHVMGQGDMRTHAHRIACLQTGLSIGNINGSSGVGLISGNHTLRPWRLELEAWREVVLE